MKIIPIGVLEDNYSYILIDDKTKEAAVIDPWVLFLLFSTFLYIYIYYINVVDKENKWDVIKCVYIHFYGQSK